MPYILPVRRDILMQFNEKDRRLHISTLDIEGPGELEYIFYRLCQLYIVKHGRKFEVLNAIVGVLETTKGEVCRRILEPYEDRKMRENGDVG
jgi:hypothetical protein